MRKFIIRLKKFIVRSFIPLILSIVVMMVTYLLWDWFAQVDEEGKLLVTNSELIRNAALVIAGIWGAYGVMIAARRVEIQESGQVAERYARAAEQLDSESESVRMVAVLALQKLAKEADRETYQNVVKVFCTYTRERHLEDEPSSTALPESVRQILNFLIEIPQEERRVGKTMLIDLSKTNLKNLSRVFKGKDLSNFNFEGASLFNDAGEHDEIERVDMEDALLKDANMQNAYIISADLENASLENANMQRTNLESANLRNASLKGANMQYAFLQSASLENASLRGANMRYAQFEEADLENADMEGALLDGADFTNAYMKGALLSETLGLDSARGIETVQDPPQAIKDEIERRRLLPFKAGR